MNLAEAAILVFGYGAVGVFAFGRFTTVARNSRDPEDHAFLLEAQLTVRGFVFSTLMVATWPIWWALPATVVMAGSAFRA